MVSGLALLSMVEAVAGAVVLPPSAFERDADGAYVCDLAKLGVDCGDTTYRTRGWAAGAPDYPALFFGNEPGVLAREPNTGWFTFTAADVVADGSGDPGAFRCHENLPAGGYSLNGYWTEDWANETLRVEAFTNGVMQLADRHDFGIGRKSWGAKVRRYHAVNHRAFLDAPGEWYLDPAARKLYVMPPTGDIAATPVYLAVDPGPVLGLHHRRELTLANRTIAFGRGTGLELRDCHHVTISNCVIECVAGNGIDIGGDCTDITVVDCTIRNVGRCGVALAGGDRGRLAPGRNAVRNCEIVRFARLQRVYAPGVSLHGCGNEIRGCRIHDAPHSAILYGGNEHVIADNEIYDVIQETGDAGAIYTGRDWTSMGNRVTGNYIHDLGATVVGENARDVFTMGVYLDDCDGGDTVASNRFENAGCAIMIGGGRENTVLANRIVNCRKGIHLDDRGVTWTNRWNSPDDPSWNLLAKAERLKYRDDPWKSRYPRLARIMDDEPRLPLYTTFTSNVFLACERPYDFDTAASVEYRLKTFFAEKTGLIYNCPPARCEPAASFTDGFMPWTAARGYGRGMEDSAILNGLALSMFVDKYDRDWAAKIADGLLRLETVHGVKGFVARGICLEDGRSVCTLSSRDQITHFIHGLFRYYESGLADDARKARIRTALAEVADRMCANVTAANDWNALMADGKKDPKGLLKMWNVQAHEAARLPAIYAAAWKATGDGKYADAYARYADAALAQSAAVTEIPAEQRQWSMPGYAFVQMNAALETMALCDPARRERCWAVMKDVARLAADRFLAERGADGPWLSAAGDLAYAVMMVARLEPLEGVLGATRARAFRELYEDCRHGLNGQPPLYAPGTHPDRLVSLLGAWYRDPHRR
ncbi:MAG: right-handed parallel beta-helix repeat-containing protein [Kiritimatiellia bacterium]